MGSTGGSRPASTTTALFAERARTSAGLQSEGTTVVATSEHAIDPWDAAIEQMSSEGDLRLRRTVADTLMAGRAHERFDQYYKGVPVYGGGLSRQTDRGTTVSVFGTVYAELDLDTTPQISAEEVRVMVEQAKNVTIGPSRAPELVILPAPAGSGDVCAPRLVYRVVTFTAEGGIESFVDAITGTIVFEREAAKRQNVSALGRGQGVLGDEKKISVMSQSGAYYASDLLRPPSLQTFDMRGDLTKTLNFLNGTVALVTSDLATSPSIDWSDRANVDAQAYIGYVYDFLFKRFGRRGLDNNDIRLVNVVHPVRREDIFTAPPAVLNTFYTNAFYAGNGVMVYGEGLPPGLVTSAGQAVNYLAGALDVVAHELTHGVMEFTSNLIYLNESGALNEAFSDMMATAVEFYFQPLGTGLLKADYVIGEDVFTPGGVRSIANPAASGNPDHYSNRYVGTADSGGVHINSTIVTHAYYLAVEGGTNATSGQSVQGVGPANRAQIENVYYRAFTQMMPSNATFSVARAVTLQAARDLYGIGSFVEQTLTQAWTAVGVN